MTLQSLLVALLLAASVSCRHGVDVTVCVLDPEANGLECSSSGGPAFFLPLPEAQNFVCMSPDDTEKVLKACRGSREI